MILVVKKYLKGILTSEMMFFIWVWILKPRKEIKREVRSPLKKKLVCKFINLDRPPVASKRPLTVQFKIGFLINKLIPSQRSK